MHYSNLGLLSRFIGMITELAFVHELSAPTSISAGRSGNLIGRDIKNGLIPDDEKLVGAMIKNICYANAKNYMAFPGVK